MASWGFPVGGGAEWGQSPSAPVTPGGLDLLNSINDVWFRLGFLNPADLATEGRWTGLVELYQFGDDAAKRVSYLAGLFVTADSSIDVVAATASYALPAAHVFTVLAWLLYTGKIVQLLRLSTAGQLFALDGEWSATAGAPLRASMDAGAPGTVTLYPNPVNDSILGQLCQEFPAVAQGSSELPCSPVLQDYFTYAMLAGARGKESDNAMPEMASHYAARTAMYEQVMVHLWGPGQ